MLMKIIGQTYFFQNNWTKIFFQKNWTKYADENNWTKIFFQNNWSKYDDKNILTKIIFTNFFVQNVAYIFLLASQSDAHRIAPHRDPNPSHPIQSIPIPLIALKQERPMM